MILIAYCIFAFREQKVPEGDWYCAKCKPVEEVKPKKKRRQFVLYASDEESESEAESQEEEQDSDEDYEEQPQ